MAPDGARDATQLFRAFVVVDRVRDQRSRLRRAADVALGSHPPPTASVTIRTSTRPPAITR